MKLRVDCYSGGKADKRPVRFYLDEHAYSVVLKKSSTGGMAPAVRFSRSAPMTAISIFCVSTKAFREISKS